MMTATELVDIARVESRLVVTFPTPQRMLSWALYRGGFHVAERVVWQGVRNAELPPEVDASTLLEERLKAANLGDAVGLMTSGDLDRFVLAERHEGDASALCVATVGLSNALQVGDPSSPRTPAGTINLLCWSSQPLDDAAALEALSIATEARTLAVFQHAVPSIVSERPATGTGTDCIVIASPAQSPKAPYAGKHTLIGSLLGGATYAAVFEGVSDWRRRYPSVPLAT